MVVAELYEEEEGEVEYIKSSLLNNSTLQTEISHPLHLLIYFAYTCTMCIVTELAGEENEFDSTVSPSGE